MLASGRPSSERSQARPKDAESSRIGIGELCRQFTEEASVHEHVWSCVASSES